MLRKLALLLLAPTLAVGLALGLAVAEEGSSAIKIEWYGQACFSLDFPGGLVVLVDPFDASKIGSYAFPKDVRPDLVTISHEHYDHNNDKEVSGKPEVLRGLTSADAKTQDWQKHDLVRKGVRIRTVGVYHDESSGKERGKNTVFVFEPEKKGAFGTIAHLGDLGHLLTDEQVKAIGPIDALLIPVGGHFTIDAEAAKKVCDQLKPRRIIMPMHYKTDALKPELPLARADAFLDLFPGKVKKVSGNETTLEAKGGDLEVVVLDYKKESGMKDGGQGLQVGTAKAWVNAQPGKPPELHLSAEVTATASGKGAVLKVEATLSGKKVELEDDATSEAQPEGGFKLEAGKKRTLKLVAKDGQSGESGGELKLTFKLEGPGQSSSSSTSVKVQTVR
jgi:L-ascorbate metabolism protein UlaG (beta-lactamase superfamily)